MQINFESQTQESVYKHFLKKYNYKPTFLVRSPGRVNIIGEHTDYNDGFVLPIAINRATYIAIEPTNDDLVTIESLDFKREVQIDLKSFVKEQNSWIEYLKGVANSLQKNGYKLKGFRAVVVGDVPIGAGLSSSASFELAISKCFSLSSNFEWDSSKMALISQQAENNWVGVNCGIMDQMISASGQKDRAVLIDCRDLQTKLVKMPQNTKLVILDTSTRRGLVDSAYNERRSQCEKVCEIFGVKFLRDISVDFLEQNKHLLSDLEYKRAKHVVSENQRVIFSVEAANANNAKLLGDYMYQSHVSLRDDFEVTNNELDLIVEISRQQKGCFGARMTGAGFGGCAVALVEEDLVEDFKTKVFQKYTSQTGLKPFVYITPATEGTNFQKL